MAEIKNINVEQFVKQIEQAARSARDSFERSTRESIEAVKDAAAQLAAVAPSDLLKLFEGSDALYVGTLEIAGDPPTWPHAYVRVQMDTGSGTIGAMLGQPSPALFDPKRRPRNYRLVLAFLPVPDGEKR